MCSLEIRPQNSEFSLPRRGHVVITRPPAADVLSVMTVTEEEVDEIGAQSSCEENDAMINSGNGRNCNMHREPGRKWWIAPRGVRARMRVYTGAEPSSCAVFFRIQC